MYLELKKDRSGTADRDLEVTSLSFNRPMVCKHFLLAGHCAIAVHWLAQGKQELYS